MLTFDLVQNDKHLTNDLPRPKNLRFSSRTNLIKNRCGLYYDRKIHKKNCNSKNIKN